MRSEVSEFQPQLDVLIKFVEGRLEPDSLEEALATEEMKTLLGVFEDKRYPALTNFYRKLHNNQDRTTLGGLVNAEGIIEDFLRKAEVGCQPSKRYFNAYTLIKKSVPEYLDPPWEFMSEKIIPSGGDKLSEAQTKKLIKERLKECFKYVDKPPKWIQNPDWPIHNGTPLVFIGQIDINAPDLFHDVGTAFVFFNAAEGTFETISQFH